MQLAPDIHSAEDAVARFFANTLPANVTRSIEPLRTYLKRQHELRGIWRHYSLPFVSLFGAYGLEWERGDYGISVCDLHYANDGMHPGAAEFPRTMISDLIYHRLVGGFTRAVELSGSGAGRRLSKENTRRDSRPAGHEHSSLLARYEHHSWPSHAASFAARPEGTAGGGKGGVVGGGLGSVVGGDPSRGRRLGTLLESLPRALRELPVRTGLLCFDFDRHGFDAAMKAPFSRASRWELTREQHQRIQAAKRSGAQSDPGVKPLFEMLEAARFKGLEERSGGN